MSWRKERRDLIGSAFFTVCNKKKDAYTLVCGLPLRSKATLGSLCTGLMSSSTSVCLPHSGLAWLICGMKGLSCHVGAQLEEIYATNAPE